MKKILALILAALMIVSLMVGCSKSDSTDKPTNNVAPESSSTANTSDAAEPYTRTPLRLPLPLTRTIWMVR